MTDPSARKVRNAAAQRRYRLRHRDRFLAYYRTYRRKHRRRINAFCRTWMRTYRIHQRLWIALDWMKE